jgi:AraC-like DNA-binding protein
MGSLLRELREAHAIGAHTREWLVPSTGCPALREARIHLCGISEARPGFAFVRRCPERSQLLYAVTAGGCAWVGDGWRDLAAGECYLTPPGVPHAYRCRSGVRWRVAWLILDEPDDAPRLVTTAEPSVVLCDPRPVDDAILNLHRETVGSGDPGMLRLWGELIAAHMRRHLSPIRTDQRLWRLWEEIDADLGQPWTLGDLARRSGLGDEQLRRLCRRHLGSSPMQHLARLRMRRAAALLTAGGRSVSDAAAAVGYGNAFAFSTAFRRIMGQPPSLLLPAPPLAEPDRAARRRRPGDAARQRSRA